MLHGYMVAWLAGNKPSVSLASHATMQPCNNNILQIIIQSLLNTDFCILSHNG